METFALLWSLVFSCVAVIKTVEILLDMAWTRRCGRSFAAAVEAEHIYVGRVDISDLERDFKRRQPVYSLLARLGRRCPSMAFILRSLYWGPLLATIGFLTTLIPAPSWIRSIVGFQLILFALLLLLNAPWRRFFLGPYDRYNRDLVFTAGLKPASKPSLTRERAAVALSSYFVWLVYVSVVAFAGGYFVVARQFPGAYQPPDVSVMDALFLSLGNVSTVDIVQHQGATVIGQSLTALQVLTGPLMFAWLLSELFSSAPAPATNGAQEETREDTGIKLVAAALIRDNQVLLSLRSTKSDFRPGVWDLFGGHIVGGEAARDAIRRELREELGIEAVLESESPVARWFEDGLDLSIWIVREWVGTPRNLVQGSHDQIGWFRSDQLQAISLGDYRYERFLNRVMNT